jgi:hypothetical protein
MSIVDVSRIREIAGRCNTMSRDDHLLLKGIIQKGERETVEIATKSQKIIKGKELKNLGKKNENVKLVNEDLREWKQLKKK